MATADAASDLPVGIEQIEEHIHKLCAEVLSRPVARIKLARSFVAQGGDSLLAIKLMARCQDSGYIINIQDLLQATSIREFCQHVKPEVAALPVPNIANGSESALSNGQAGRPKTKLLDERNGARADGAGLPDPADMVGVVGKGQKTEGRKAGTEEESKGCGDAESDVPPFALWKEAQLGQGGGSSSSSTLQDQLRLVADQCGISVDVIEDVYPCTPLQEGLMAVTAQQPGAYVNRWVYRMPRDLDAERFKQSWVLVARAAPLLRTRLVLGELGRALQVVVRQDIHIPASPPFTRFIRYLGDCDRALAESFWRSELGGEVGSPFPPRRDPLYRPNPTQRMVYELKVPPAPACITMAGLLRAAWALVVSSHTGDDDVVFASVLTGRTTPVRGISDMLAPVIATVPVRVRIDRTQPVADYMASVQQQAVSMMPFEHTGLQNIYRHIGARPDIAHFFGVQPAGLLTSHTTAPPLGLELHIAPSSGTDDYALSVECITELSNDAAAVQVSVRFDDTMVSRALLERLLGRFAHILVSLTHVFEKDGLRMALVEEVDAPTVASNTQEQQLQAVLVDVLGLPVGKVVMNRSFLSLGGDSISAMQVVAQCRSRHGTTLTVRDVLQSTSIAQIASRAAAGAATGHVQDAAPHKPLKVLLEQFTTSPVLFPETSDLSSAGLTYDGLAQLWASVSEAGITSLDEVHDVHPCAPTQQGIMMSQIRDPTMYNIEHICELQVPEASGRVDINKLSQAWQAVVNRHAILRTIFVQATTGQEHLFYQVVLKKCTPQVRLIEEKGAAGTIAALSRVEQAAYVKGKPSHCLTLCATESGAVFAKLEISHALVDGVSLELVLRDVARAYKGALPGSAGPQFGSYVQFLREKRESESLAYWTHRLADAQPCYLPSSIALPPGTRSLKSVTVQIGDAINILHGFRDAQRIPGSNEIVGPMVNIMVSRIHLGNLPATVAHAAQKVQNDFLDAFENQRTSLGSIQHALRLPGRSLFNTVVSLFRQSSEHAPTSSADLVIRNITSEGPTEYDANLMVLAGDDTMALSLKYSGSFMDEESARLVLENTRHTLIAIASSSESKLDELETLSPSDVEKLLKWKPDLPLATGQDCLHQRIHQQRLARPDGQAVCAWDGELTYAELDAFSDRLACHLDGLGIREETIVGLCFEKSMWTIVAMLAVLKAGGVIVPLGTALPPQRLRFILENTKAAVVLTSAQCAAKFEHMEMAHKHTVDATLFTVLPDVVGPPARPSLTPDNTAFVLYTSGSTGLPKGVVLTHASLSTSLDAHGAKLGFSTSTRALQYSAYVFDLSLLELLGTLRFGGCICTVSGEDRLSPNLLAHSMTTMGVNFASTTPTVASILDPSTVPTLRTLMLGGEPLEPTTVERWSGHDVVLYNCYGPTECSIMSTINGPVTDPNLSRNVGYPVVANVWVADQDNHNHLVPIGAAGELLIEGPVVARGYLHDPEKTAAGFITDPEFASRYESAPPDGRTQRRMYRTGDLVRQSPTDGSLTYVGRRDGQVKIRGQRLEVGEIEHWAKGSFAQARMVAADLIAPAARKGAPVLALALELDIPCQGTPDGTSPLLPLTHSLRRSLSALQDALEQVLPSFMVPALYVPVQSMPLTVSGKLDRGRLRAYSLIGASGPSARALTTSESRLRDLWVSALSSAGVVGPASHFFRLGGDSVTAMRLIRLSVADVFGNPVLENMAKTVASEPGDSTAIVNGNAAAMDAAPFSLMPTSSAAQDTQLTRLSAQCGVAEELLALTARRQSAYVGCWVFRMGDALDADRFRSAWEKVSEAAVILRTRIIAGNDAQVGTQLVLRESLPWRMNEPEPMGVGTSLMRFTVVSTPSAYDDVYSGRDAPTFAPFTRYIKYIRGANGDSEAREYWRSQLTGDVGSAFPVIPPNHQPRPSSTVSLRVTPSVTPSVTPAATSSNFTTATLLRAAWALVLSQETGMPGILDMAAPTLAAVPVHINTDRNRSVADYLSANINQMLPEKTLDLNHLFDSASLLPQGLEWVPYGVECNTGAEAENKGDAVLPSDKAREIMERFKHIFIQLRAAASSSGVDSSTPWVQPTDPSSDACIHDLVHQQRLRQPDAQALDHLLGVQAGGIIVPVGHNYPVQRVQHIIQATGANVILASKMYEAHRGLVPHVLPALACGTAKPTDAAFTLFTSGSTGTPKGVVLEHRSLVASLKAQRGLFAGPAARTFVPLIMGGCVCVPSEDDRVGDLAGAMEAMKVNLAHLTPTMGEALTSEAASRWLVGHIRAAGEAPNIGTAIAGSNLWVVEPFDHNCDEKKTTAAFVTDPTWVQYFDLGPRKGRRFYRTGDLYLGRRDTQHWVQKVLGARAGATVAAAGEPALAVAPFTLLPLSDDQRQLFGRVRASLSEVLPSYMVPHSGKVDRRAVWTTIQQSRLSSQYSVITNRTRLQQLWAAALRIPPQEIWAGDDFFLSGGDSMSAMRMVAKAREATRMPLTVADIFQYPILADLAKVSVYQAFSAMGVAEPGPYGCHAVDAAPVTDSQSLFVVSSLRKTRSCDVEKTAYIFVNEQMLQVTNDAAIDGFTKELLDYDALTMFHLLDDLTEPSSFIRDYVSALQGSPETQQKSAAMPRIAPPHQHDRDSQAAWGLTLARTGQPAAATAVGCCANIVPARIVIRANASHVARLPHETVGFRELLGNSGKVEAEDPHFTTRINHRDRPPRGTLQRIGDTTYQTAFSLSEDAEDLPDMSLTSHPYPDHIEVIFHYREGAISAEAAEHFMSCLCAVSELLAATSSQSMRLGEIELGPHAVGWPVVGNGSVALGIGQSEEGDCGVSD
ncbi:uncharacterized protein B0H64DRAFT_425642 [Chaetomium fimeti]|uniref:Carrier domain-containing protein n=1 Tax=Chaetomium fimeti TaxID=1854472 RepID=A0AAE0LQ50_9PEZI|nr:hypothetical protein B0H64DRAFT_425642 [Chaetomium fimeti]